MAMVFVFGGLTVFLEILEEEPDGQKTRIGE
jgi:hypothetical protein